MVVRSNQHGQISMGSHRTIIRTNPLITLHKKHNIGSLLVSLPKLKDGLTAFGQFLVGY